MPHDHKHHHHHHHNFNDSSTLKLWISIFLNLAITIAEFVGGILSNSLALLSDAVHNLNDTLSLAISLVARKISKKGANNDKTFGYKRAEIIGAFINLITLVLVALFLIKEGVERFFDPQPIDGFTMFWVAIVGLLGNFITAALLFKDSKDNLNLKSAYIHILSDGLSSVGVIIGGWLILKYEWYIVDTFLTVGIGAYILWHSYHMLQETTDILMQSTPEQINLPELTSRIEKIHKVQEVHHVHVWRLDENEIMMESHIVVDEEDINEMEVIKKEIKTLLHDDFGIHHSTLEFECQPCSSHHHEALTHHH
ncbi:MAG TPA: cation transporter [Balneola sp.]|jgi:cobalt-zinc-cadmium efflux system protein|nr:cation transporter [Bacteroidota bacterium]MAO77724.1 cation transporter [Balneola sp.]MBF63865.1 cation transporter [Balneola sp.]HAW81615.1 cation transporter [Balneola sp.]HBZ37371.1 cation transporter [Balneola sp.]|tara:strand:- start:6418 stop:7347 length:930 start_codon:yes stop_codon:yes gene_type:complete